MDFAFKLVLGSPEHSGITIHFLNSILVDQPRNAQVKILNPWAYFLQNAEQLTPEEIRKVFPDQEFSEAAGVLEMISRTPEQLMAYNAIAGRTT